MMKFDQMILSRMKCTQIDTFIKFSAVHLKCTLFKHNTCTKFELGKPSLKKTIFLLTFVNKDFTPPPPNYWQKTIEVRGPVRGVTPPLFIKVKNNIV